MSRVEVGILNQLPEKLGKAIKVGRKEIALFRLSNGEVRALENRCPHKGGDLSQGIVCGQYVFCPLHDWKICTENGEVQKPDDGCVKTYLVEIENKKVYVHL